MAKQSLIQKAHKDAKFSTRNYTRCEICGRPRAVMQKFNICRIDFRKLAHEGMIPGVKKAS